MNKLILAFCFIITIISCSRKLDVVRDQPKDFLYAPNCYWLRDNLQIDVTEISNVHYREYLYWLSKEYPMDSSIYLNAFPNTLVWREMYFNYQPFVNYYLSHPTYAHMPVVGVTNQQAEAYCKWRSFVVNQMIYRNKEKLKIENQDTLYHFPVKYLYRLPTKEEWEYAALAGDSLTEQTFGFESILDGEESFIFSKENATIKSYDAVNRVFNNIIPIQVFEGKKNRYGLYNMIGNVAELVQEEGIAKGGSFYHNLDSSRIIIDIPYSTPKAWLGFRCVCEVMENDTLIKPKELLDAQKYIPTASIDKTVYPEPQSLKINIDSIFADTMQKLFYISIDEIKKVKYLSDIFDIKPDTVLSYEVVFGAANGHVISEAADTDDLPVMFLANLPLVKQGNVALFSFVLYKKEEERNVYHTIKFIFVN